MYVGLKQPRGDGERYVTPARAAAKETNDWLKLITYLNKLRVKCIIRLRVYSRGP